MRYTDVYIIHIGRPTPQPSSTWLHLLLTALCYGKINLDRTPLLLEKIHDHLTEDTERSESHIKAVLSDMGTAIAFVGIMHSLCRNKRVVDDILYKVLSLTYLCMRQEGAVLSTIFTYKRNNLTIPEVISMACQRHLCSGDLTYARKISIVFLRLFL